MTTEAKPEPRCAYCARPDGWRGHTLILEPKGWLGPMHRECIEDIRLYGCD